MLPIPIMSTETLESCAEASETRAAKTNATNKIRFIMRQIWAPSPHRSRGESEQQTGGEYAAIRLRYGESARRRSFGSASRASFPLPNVMLVSRQGLFKGLLRYRRLVSSEQKEDQVATSSRSHSCVPQPTIPVKLNSARPRRCNAKLTCAEASKSSS